jgi:lipoprotein Spr
MRVFLITFILMLSTLCHAGEREEFEAYKQQIKNEQKKNKEEFRVYSKKMNGEWSSYLADIRKNFGPVEFTTDKKWVNYSKDHKAKVVLDNDKGVVTIEFVAGKNNKAARIREAQALVKALSKDINPFSSAPVLTENVPLDKFRLDNAKAKRSSGKAGEKVYSLSIPMNEDRQQNNEVQIAESVRDMTEKYNVSYDLVMAIIKTESNFNVGAGTRKGALDMRNPKLYENNPWGLMQVVPMRSGREGLKRAKGKNRLPTADELLDPKLNLEIGVAYLAQLQEHDFAGIKDEASRERVMIAAYRDGPEKIYMRFGASGNRARAVAEINKLGLAKMSAILAEKNSSHGGDSQYVAKVEKERNNYRVSDEEKQQLEKMTDNIVQGPELRAAVEQWLGTPYRLGGTTRNAVDCSGFTMKIYAQVFNKQIPRTSEGQYETYGRSAVKAPSRQEGDLVYFNTLHNGKPVSHVGLWLDDKRFVHASSSRGVVISNIDEAYYRSRYVGANRPVRE